MRYRAWFPLSSPPPSSRPATSEAQCARPRQRIANGTPSERRDGATFAPEEAFIAIEYRILGPLEIWRDGQLVPVGPPKQRALLGFLLLNANRVVSTRELLEDVWGPDPSPSARASLQNHVTRLRRLLGTEAIETVPNGYRMVVAEDALDVDRFERAVVAARALPAAERAEALRTALAVWRGLPLVDALTSPTTQAVIIQLEERRLEAVESRFEAELAAGVDAELVAELEGLVVLHPFREQFWRLLMLALHRSGRQADALGAYRRVHRIFASELGLEPSDSLKELQRRILVGDAEPERPRQADDVLLRATLLLPAERAARARALVEYGTALRRLGEIERADVVLAEAKRLAWESGGDAARKHVALTISQARTFDEAAPLGDVLREARRAGAIFARAGDHAARAAALRTEGQMLRDLGRIGDAVTAFEASIEAALAGGARWEEGMSRNFLATAHLYGPTPAAEAIAICERQLSALEWGPPGPIGLWGSLGWLLAMNGDPIGGRQVAMRAVDGTRAASTPSTHCWALGIVAEIDELSGDVASAVDGLRAIVEILDSLGNEGALGLHGAELARLIAREDRDEAEALARRSRSRAAHDDFSSQVAWRRALARIVHRSEATRLFTEAVALAMKSDFLDLRGRALEDLAELEAPPAARRALRRALRAFERKGNRLAVARVVRTLESLSR